MSGRNNENDAYARDPNPSEQIKTRWEMLVVLLVIAVTLAAMIIDASVKPAPPTVDEMNK